MQKDSDKISPDMLKEAEKKMGMTPDQIKKAIDSGDVSGIMKNLGKTDAQKVQKVLSNKDSAMKLLSTPQAQALLKKFLGGK